jgi:hypothetical protein
MTVLRGLSSSMGFSVRTKLRKSKLEISLHTFKDRIDSATGITKSME